jgi:hypothetical protein
MLFIYFRDDDERAKASAHQLITEGGKTEHLKGGWSVRRERSHHNPEKYHTHIMMHGNDVSVINADGTQSHGTTRDHVPNRVISHCISKKYFTEEAAIWNSHTIDPIVADKVRRIEKFGVIFELEFIPAVTRVLSRMARWR